ncbi:DNA polymerase Y family protein [[Clostridium] hylemonae]|uniref:DNA polymerase IV n=1 Tax=[Clostridium] hylemonae DSM 15053 TaxID=553973 RepID=C0BYL2_9FIRM|nr:DNA polymerase IV [[Clostridium] hylemonae]EEG74940.1 ImpB/MucB/SamB family protein [[Clostridium] hylemonae DSM 15053]QEK18292.1 DNA polymerase IV [[Clostridium] hylemonae DSM 15053]
MSEQIIYHIDVNSAFLSWEAVFRLGFLGASVDLRDIPSAIGGDVKQRHGIILAKSIPAKAYGIKTGESIPEARQKCPGLYIAPPNYGLYENCSRAFTNILKEYTPVVEQYSIDEVFMDMSGMQRLFGDPVKTAFDIKERIRRELGFTVNIGVSSNKLLAKMASDFKKPDRVHTLFPEEIKTKMWRLPVNDLFFVGRATAKKLHKLGVYTIGQLAGADPELLRMHLKSHGEVIWNFANGRDFSIVEAAPVPNKGYGNSTTTPFDVTDAAAAKLVLLALAETIGMRLRKDSVKIQVISIGIKDREFRQMSHQTVLPDPTNITKEIYEVSCRLFEELWDHAPIRHLGIHTARVKEEGELRQLSLFDHTDYRKLETWDRTIDRVRGRFGIDAVKRAAFLAVPEIDHLSGGVSREKRTVDYEKLKIE